MTNFPDLKTLVKDNNAFFDYYYDGNLWYYVFYNDYERFNFPVPLSDIGNATFSHTEKALLMMRYIRKQIKLIEEAKLVTN